MTTHRPRSRAAIAMIAAGATAVALGAAASPAIAEEPAGPIASYSFNGGSFADQVGDADLTEAGSAAVAADDDRGDALYLDGSTGGYAAFPEGFFDGRDTMTVSLDAKSELSSGNFFTFAFGQDDQQYYFLRTRGGDVRSAITTGSWGAESAVTGSVASGAWHHYDIVFDGATMTVYVDGAQLGTNTELSATVSDLGTGLAGYLGKSFYGADGAFKGWFDDVEVYDRALTAGEVIDKSGASDQLVGLGLEDESVLQAPAIVDGASHTGTFLVERGTDVTALTPTFAAASTATVSPASGTTVDMTEPVGYTISADDGSSTEWTLRAEEMRSPVLDGYNADPNIAVFGDTYYMYVTSDGHAGWGGKTFFVWKSKDLVNWTRSAKPFLTLDGENGDVPWATGNAWAPTIIERDGKYYFYFSGHNAELDRKTIGVAVADSPEGPFTAEPEAMILNNESVTSGQAIDPAAFEDPETGAFYLAWGNGGGNPIIAELGDDMVSLKEGTLRKTTGLQDFREGVFLNYRDGLYHLTYSIDDTGSENYRVGYATATSMDGPWTYRGVILEKDLSLGIKGPGHNSIINVPGTDEWYIAYHRFGIPGGDGNHRETTIDRLTFGEDGLMQKVPPTISSIDPLEVSDADRDAFDLEEISLGGLDDVRDHLTLPETGSVYGGDISWSASPEGIVSTSADGEKAAGYVTRPAHGEGDAVVTLTASIGGAERTFEATVRELPEDEDPSAYLFAHFTSGKSPDTINEQMYFAASEDGATWTDLNDEQPVLTSDVGEEGVRDPYLVRAPGGDKFYLIATDLSTATYGWHYTPDNPGSTDIVVWESTDLVNWSEPRLADVASRIPNPGAAWAPEAIYDPSRGVYMVYWATISGASSDHPLGNELGDGMNMYYATTRDFVTFTEPVKWIDRDHSIIDTTMIEVDGTFYRASGDGQITIEKSTDPYAVTVADSALESNPGGWEKVSTLSEIFGTENYSGAKLEGPEFFEYNPDDWQTDESGEPVPTWGVMADQYSSGKGYLPFRSTDLASTSPDADGGAWAVGSDIDFDSVLKRHGTILPVTQTEYARLMSVYGDAPAIAVTATTRCVAGKSVVVASATNAGADAVTATIATDYGTREGVEIAAGATVSKTFSTRAAEAEAGTVTVSTEAGAVTAEYAAASCG